MIMRKYIICCAVVLLLCHNFVYAQDFGRLFTTPRQRQQLDELRKARAGDIVIDIKDEEMDIDEETTIEENNTGDIVIKGLVHRSDGKNTAWINESNSYEGDLSSQYTGIIENRISRDRVEVEMTGEDGKNLSLKVGQSYNPFTRDIRDITGGKSAVVDAPPDKD